MLIIGQKKNKNTHTHTKKKNPTNQQTNKKTTELQPEEAGLVLKEIGKFTCSWIKENGDEDNVSVREVNLK